MGPGGTWFEAAAGGYADAAAALDDNWLTSTIPAFGSWDLGSDSYVTAWDGTDLTVDMSVTTRTAAAQMDGFQVDSAALDAVAAKTRPWEWALVIRPRWTTNFAAYAPQPNMILAHHNGTTTPMSRNASCRVQGTRRTGAAKRRVTSATSMTPAVGLLGGDIDQIDRVSFVISGHPPASGGAMSWTNLDSAFSTLWFGFTHSASGGSAGQTLLGFALDYQVIPFADGAT